MSIKIQHLSVILLHLIMFLLPCSIVASPIGLCYGRVANNLPPPSNVINVLQSNGITNVRVFNTDPTTLKSFSGTGIDLIIGIANEDLPTIATASADSSVQWLQSNIFTYIPSNQVKYIAVGNEVFLNDPYYTPYVVPSLLNLYEALRIMNLDNRIKLSSPQAAVVLSQSYPPSNGRFDANVQPVMRSLLQFLRETGSPFMVNVYPYISYVNNANYVPLDYALFRAKAMVEDGQLVYGNLFEASIDAFVYAMEKEGFDGIQIVVTETGWPTSGGEAASADNALAYNENVVRMVTDNIGTPKRPLERVEVYLFDLFDENGKSGADYERHFGIFTLDGFKAYDLNFN